MSLLKEATNQTAYLKLGIYGFQGSGKTYLAVDFAIGMAKQLKGKRVAFFDTEKGSDFHIRRIQDAGVKLDVIKSRSFVDLLDVVKEAEAGKYSFLVIDSVTHVWRELMESCLKKKAERVRKWNNDKKVQVNLTMKDWMVLKQEWAQFSDLFVNSKLHIAACGRAGFDYDVSEDEEGKQEVVKSGTKMKAEGEFGYESDLLLEVYRVPLAEIQKNKKAKGFEHRCIVLKDRTDTMNARVLVKPKFKDFKTVIDFLNLGGEHVGSEVVNSSVSMFGSPDRSLVEIDRQRQIAVEELDETLLLMGLDGRSDAVKLRRTQVLKEIFDSSSKTYIEGLSPEALREGIEKLRKSATEVPTDLKLRKERANGADHPQVIA